MSRGMQTRKRGFYLTDKGWNRIWTAIDAQFPDGRPKLAEISERTDPRINSQVGKFVSPDAISNIINRRAKADNSSIEALFKAFGLTVEDDDRTSDAPYIASASTDPNFVGREDDLAELDRRVKAGRKAIEIVAAGGIGKSCFAQEYLKQFDRVLEFNMARESQSVVSPFGRMEEWLKELGEEPGREFEISKERLRKKLREASSKIAIFIDNLEPTLENGLFIQPYRSEYVELLRVLTDFQVNAVTLITSREPLHESAIPVETYRLKGLDLKAWQQYFQGRNVETNSTSLEEMRNAYGGNAKAMEILCGAIQEDADSNLDAYWQKVRQDLLQHKTLEHLVATQFDRLEQKNRNAYNLLCRLGCYRYQDVPLVPEEGVLCLLWDVSEKPLRVLNALKDRCLVDVSQQQYRLHPVIREMAIDRLRQNLEDWKTANRKAAEFWTESINTVVMVEDAIQSLEAYYHYVEIEDFESAATVITKRRKNQWGYEEPLGVDFYRLGLLQKLIELIGNIIDRVALGYSLVCLYNILGDAYWLIGKLHDAIQCHKNCQETALNVINSNSILIQKSLVRTKNGYIVSFLNLGLCYIDLLRYEKALNSFETLRDLCKDPECKPHHRVSWRYCLAFLNSYHQEDENRRRALSLLNESFFVVQNTDLNAWNIGYRFLFSGLTYKKLGDIQKSFEMFNETIQYAEEVNYPQVKARALTGLGELHRIQGDFAKAIPLHQESIALLDEIRAKCDLAEAYFQCALTYQEMGETENSNENFEAALQLFREIDAPKQIERVQSARKTD
jgi:tetratricopeptide (TPR) repeat protein